MLWNIIVWGLATGVVHFVAIGILYGNPWIDRLYARARGSGICGSRRAIHGRSCWWRRSTEHSAP
jgi:hypothetical protein